MHRGIAVVSMGLVWVTASLAQELSQRYLLRHLSNHVQYPNLPYMTVLTSVEYQRGSYALEGGMSLYKDHDDRGIALNHGAITYHGADLDFKIGKQGTKVGVLDYLSSLDTLNPTRVGFFDDPEIEVRKIPLWMADLHYFVGDATTLRAVVQPFDGRYQNYTAAYVGYLLDQYLPDYFASLETESDALETIKRQIFLPAYNRQISPQLNDDIVSQTPETGIDVGKSLVMLGMEYGGWDTTYGVVWSNRYSEVPYVEVDAYLLEGALNLQRGEDASQELRRYLDQEDLTPVKRVQGYRYNQYGAYAETTLGAYGVRGEFSYRDRLPAINAFSGLQTFGVGVDRSLGTLYMNVELQWAYLERYREQVVATILASRFPLGVYSGMAFYWDGYIIGGYVDDASSLSLYPGVSVMSGPWMLSCQYLHVSHDPDFNTFGVLLKAQF